MQSPCRVLKDSLIERPENRRKKRREERKIKNLKQGRRRDR
jgi:hypothetical protein